MRLVAGLLALTLTGTFAHAEEAKAPEPQPRPAERSRGKVGLRVVRVMPESHQALLFDKNRDKHVLADVGSSIGGYTVTEIDDDEVTLESAGREVVLAAPASSWRGRRAAAAAVPTKEPPAADTKALAPADPYAEPAAAGPTDPQPQPGESAVRVATAPSSEPLTNPYDEAALEAAVTAGTGDVRVARAPDAVTITEMEVDPYGEPTPEPPATDVDEDPYAEPAPAAAGAPPAPVATAEPKPAARPAAQPDPGVRAFVEAMNGQVIVNTPDAAPAPAPIPTPAVEPATMLSRKELTTALADFGVLTASVRGAFTPAGARLDVVAPGSVFAKAGLRNGDVITSVDGAPLKSIDDAADLYIRAGSVKTANVQLLRAGKPMTLRLTIQ